MALKVPSPQNESDGSYPVHTVWVNAGANVGVRGWPSTEWENYFRPMWVKVVWMVGNHGLIN